MAVADITTKPKWQQRAPIWAAAKEIADLTNQIGVDHGEAYLTIHYPHFRPQIVLLINRILQEGTTNESA